MAPGLLAGNNIPTRYTCDGQDISPPVRWTGVPQHTAELALFVVSFQPVHDQLFFDWAVAGLPPTLQSISPGRLPPGAVVGRNGFGQDRYSICPTKGTRESYAVKLMALPRKLSGTPGFDASRFYREAERDATAAGFAGVTYVRP